MKIDLIMVVLNLLLMIAAAVVLIKLIVRTEKGLDIAFKVLIIVPIVLAITSLFQFDQLSGVFSKGHAQFVFYTSRFVANVAFLIACLILLKTVTKESGEK